MHYGIRKPPPFRLKEFPREGIVVFLGAYGQPKPAGLTLKTDVHLVEYGWSFGWEASRIRLPIQSPMEPPAEWLTDVFAATFSKYTLLGRRGLVALGPQYGFLKNETSGLRQYFGGQATLSYRLHRDLWISGKIQYKSSTCPIHVKFGVATLLW